LVTGTASTVTAGERGSIVAIRYPTIGSPVVSSTQVTVISVSQGAMRSIVKVLPLRVAQPLSRGSPKV
jgi:hypothetical protein